MVRNRYKAGTSMNKRLKLQPDSKLFLFMSGHGGDNYAKIMDTQIVY
jgi:glycosylphosphatidylinositol transamidase (GPIT) subunit GPI8